MRPVELAAEEGTTETMGSKPSLCLLCDLGQVPYCSISMKWLLADVRFNELMTPKPLQ